MRKSFNRAALLAVLFLSHLFASSAHAATVDLPRFPSISPDASYIVFSWRGDLWKVAASGGHAERLTSHPAQDLRSQWTDDGSTIVFSSTRAGGTNLFAMNPDATSIRQITHEDVSLSLEDIHPDGSRIYVSSRREGDAYRAARPYHIPMTAGPIQRVHDAFSDELAISPDASRMLITRGWQSFTRKGYHGGDSRNVFLYDTHDQSFSPITNRRGHDGIARWRDNNTILFLSDRNNDATLNVFSLTLPDSDANATQLTSFTGDGVQWLDISANGSTAVFHVWDTLYTLDLTRTNAQPRALTITASADEGDDFTLRSISSDVSESALSPDGQVMAYVAYGNVYIRNTDEDSPTRRITEGEAHEHSIAWAADNTTLFFCSDETGVSDIYAATVELTRSEIVEQFEEATGTKLNPLANANANDENEDEDENEDSKDNEPIDHPAAGVWSGTYTGPADMFPPDGVPFTLTIRALADDTFEGSVTAMGDTNNISNIKWDDGSLSFESPDADGNTISISATINNEKMTGSWSTDNGPSGSFTAERTSDAPADSDDEDSDDEEDEDSPASRWHDAIKFTIEPLVVSQHNDRELQPSPDATKLAFLRERGTIMLYDFESGETETFREHWYPWNTFTWAPDSKHIAYDADDLDFNTDVWIEPIDHSWPAVNITKHPDYDGTPSFSADGRILAFESDRINDENDVWMVFLDKDLEGLTNTDLKQYFEDAESAAKKREPAEPKDDEDADEDKDADTDETEDDEEDASDDTEDTDDDEEEPLNLAEIWELDDAYLRLQRVTSLAGSENNTMITPSGQRIVFTGNHGGSHLFSVKYDGTDRKELGASASVQHISITGDKVVYVRGGQGGTVSPEGGSDETLPINDTIRIDLQEQASQKFLEAARTLGDIFYHPQMKGTDWPALSAKYHALAQQTRTPSEFSHVGAWFIGELSASHLGIYPPDEDLPNTRSNGYLAIDAEPVAGGFRVTRVIDEGPAASGSMRLEPEDVITQIEFAAFNQTDTINSRLKDRSGKETVLTIQREIEGADEPATLHVFVEPVSYSSESYMRYNQWQRDNAAKVHDWSNGRVGYLHIRAMGQQDLYEFERDLYAAGEGRDALIVDVRNNGGGWTADRVIASLTVQPHAYTIPRGANRNDTSHYPRGRLFIQRYVKPVNMMCNEKSFSNAEIVSHAFKTLDRGTLVGQESHGSVISTSGFSLIDNTWVRLPFRGWYLPDGTDMENHGAVPDIIVPQTPEDEIADHDAQLKAAVEDLLLRLN